MRPRTLLLAVWLAFLARGAFYSLEQPVWEGYDEWAHFAFLQHFAAHRTLPARTDPVSGEIARSLQLLPLSESASAAMPGAFTHDSFWKLTPGERSRRLNEARHLTSADSAGGAPAQPVLQYEAQQPPLYYVILSPLYWMLDRWTLPSRVLLLRIFNVLIASLAVVLGYEIALRVLHRTALALLAATLVASFPGFYIDVCRVSNESLTVALVTALILMCIRLCEPAAGAKEWFLMGLILSAALLTKAYSLAFFPLPVIAAWVRISRPSARHTNDARSGQRIRTIAFCGAALLTGVLAAGWWYVHAWLVTGTLSGEALDAAAAGVSLSRKILAIARVDWRTVADTTAFSHIWVGGWSFLVVRSWMYRVCEGIGALGLAGLALYAIRMAGNTHRAQRLRAAAGPGFILLAACVSMYAAVAYHSLVIFVAINSSTSNGWYLFAIVVPEAILLIAGFGQVFGRWLRPVIAAVCLMALALDLYTVHFLLMPYYTGMIAHRPSGTLEAFQIARFPQVFGEMLQRMATHGPAGFSASWVAAAWVVYLFSSAVLGWIAGWAARSKPPC